LGQRLGHWTRDETDDDDDERDDEDVQK